MKIVVKTHNNNTMRAIWIAGASLNGGEYYTQVVYSLMRKQKLWDTWSKTEGCKYFFIEIEVPHFPILEPNGCAHQLAHESKMTGQMYCGECRTWVTLEEIAIGNHTHKNK